MNSELLDAFNKLDQLKMFGVLTEAEHSQKKDELVDSWIGKSQSTPTDPPAFAGDAIVPTMPMPTGELVTGQDQEQVMCAQHGKVRSMSNLQNVGSNDDGTPRYECLQNQRCRMPEPKRVVGGPVRSISDWQCPCGTLNFAVRTICFTCASPKQEQGFAMPMAKRMRTLMHAPVSEITPKQACGMHGKIRSINALRMVNGMWICKDENACKVPAAQFPPMQHQ
eukprot:NODE_4375_length_798_cov_63.309985_g4217_i0.p1 GENE.NODE_4375_length_798_cov_63.309985_g4217_i0~~NODE_4375_length_798_cov_63.309985_g4217_i0.p1  ORF type:complete len:243 (+),score=53.21 NODE_4375_length_798_cov_63.309985_g4217_i0:62-730(+)